MTDDKENRYGKVSMLDRAVLCENQIESPEGFAPLEEYPMFCMLIPISIETNMVFWALAFRTELTVVVIVLLRAHIAAVIKFFTDSFYNERYIL